MSLCQKRSGETWLIHTVERGRFVYNTIRRPSLLPAFFPQASQSQTKSHQLRFFAAFSLKIIRWESTESIRELRVSKSPELEKCAGREEKVFQLKHFNAVWLFTAFLFHLQSAATTSSVYKAAGFTWIDIDIDNWVWMDGQMSVYSSNPARRVFCFDCFREPSSDRRAAAENKLNKIKKLPAAAFHTKAFTPSLTMCPVSFPGL